MPIITIVVALTIAMIVIAIIARSVRTDQAIGKRKRGLEGQDMYSLIDRLVDDLDEDELDYLHRRLDDRETGAKREVAGSLGELLDQREENRRSHIG
jgi:hypothetical protein